MSAPYAAARAQWADRGKVSVGIALTERDRGRDRLATTVIGDSSFQYSVQSIWSAAQHRRPVLIVLRSKSQPRK